MNQEIFIRNVYSINHYDSRNYIENNDNKIKEYLNKKYIIKNITITSSEYVASTSGKSKSVFVELFVLEKISNL